MSGASNARGKKCDGRRDAPGGQIEARYDGPVRDAMSGVLRDMLRTPRGEIRKLGTGAPLLPCLPSHTFSVAGVGGGLFC